jgi:hypothetical protein
MLVLFEMPAGYLLFKVRFKMRKQPAHSKNDGVASPENHLFVALPHQEDESLCLEYMNPALTLQSTIVTRLPLLYCRLVPLAFGLVRALVPRNVSAVGDSGKTPAAMHL